MRSSAVAHIPEVRVAAMLAVLNYKNTRVLQVYSRGMVFTTGLIKAVNYFENY
jgi:hypothetical protein